ncbi:T9SS type B sorting domain-containing protein [Flavisolibacter ginsengisoli]|jgi:gliding motility-associated-like protein|uniref:Gliding motility-associated C-terminal domain-containing protein n=1 Tax=Flavisolibacter ginsengisoli DSM 18119 TaxID=1121884 RepID=A0A1M5BWA0_9BACT|nr:gliding motility-associated C-terminal domain-containing protein [Flavisolibacter ginsengisoli]SHF46631.1 gliding motility-associated C-terminal domain-containing protein [Flavisolibacter ginsengisoli DSM 18119]
MKLFFSILSFFLFSICGKAQICTTPGQTPSTAFPVCGTSVFQQTTVPICSSHTLIVPGCSDQGGAVYEDKNPYWYKFTCFKSGKLGFVISPTDQGDDYDWQLYDITNRNPEDVFKDKSMIITGNWSGSSGNTGASSIGVNFIQCASIPDENRSTYAAMPEITAGHTYLLMVSHFTDSQVGYSLSFKNGTAVITDSTTPRLKSADVNCGRNIIRVKLKKKIKCSSLDPSGSDFILSTGSATITNATGIGCSVGFDTDSIELQLSSALSPGNYNVSIRKGNDGNTLLDYCDNAVPIADKIDFEVFPLVPTPMDNMEPVHCLPQMLKLVFSKPILCSSIDPDGSDFSISGPYAADIFGASAKCSGGSTKEILINLTTPLYKQGQFTLHLKQGNDGNTIIDECGVPTPAGSSINFTVFDTVSADFSYNKIYGCSVDTIQFSHPGGNGITEWHWSLDDNKTSTVQNPTALYTKFEKKDIQLIVSNGFCTDTSFQSVLLDNFLKADFTAYEDNCPNEPVQFTSNAQGHILQHQWSFGDGAQSSEESPAHTYTQPYNTKTYSVNYSVTDSFGCESKATKPIIIYSSCYLAVPNAFTPNNDGKNDVLKVLNAIKTEKLEFNVYNRWGQLVYKTNNWKTGWDGKVNGTPQGSGVYVWFLKYTDRDTKETRVLRGTATLIR